MLTRVPLDEVYGRVFESFSAKLGPSYRNFRWFATLLSLVGAAHISRLGTFGGRIAGASLVLGTLAGFAYERYRFQAKAKRPMVRLREIVARVEPKLAERIARAYELQSSVRDGTQGVSSELTQLHLSRLFAQIPLPQISELAARWSSKIRILTSFLVVAILATIVFDPARIVEGMNVAFAVRGRAPFSSTFVAVDPVVINFPPYLRQPSDLIDFEGSASVPRGSTLVIRGIPHLSRRNLFLTDGKQELPFVSDGQGALVVHYTVDRSVSLSVAARLGQVLIYQKTALALHAVADEPPEVELLGAPKRVDIANLVELPLRYQVRDDHGIVEVEMVLRSGSDQDRRKLVHFTQETRRYEGVTVLLTNDSFILQGTGAIEVQIVARDNNGVDGSKSRASQSLWLDKPGVGAPQVEKYEALIEIRNILVDGLDTVHRHQELSSNPSSFFETLGQAQNNYLSLVGTSGKKNLLIKNFLRAQLDKLSKHSTRRFPSEAHLSETLLAVDALVEASSLRDAEQVARQLARIAEEIEGFAKEQERAERKELALRNLPLARDRLRLGAEKLTRLGFLGKDLGNIAIAGVYRIARASQQGDYKAVERAASFLAERLNRPVPSFMGGAHPNVESGTSRSSSGGDSSAPGKPSEANTRFERVTNELRQLTLEHANLTETVRQLVENFEQNLGSDESLNEAEARASELRKIVSRLPNVGEEPGSPRASAALARELTHGAAESLSRRNFGAALDGIKQAMDALSEAERVTLAIDPTEDNAVAEYRKIRGKLSEHARWLEAELDQMRQKIGQKSAETFRKVAKEERELFERAKSIVERESKDDAVLPEEYREDLEQAARLMNEATRALEGAKGQPALDRQKRAQQLLERSELTNSQDDSEKDTASNQTDSEGRAKSGGNGSVAATSESEARERFRRRVLEGLGKDYPPDTAAKIHRYVEGLIR
jgi:cell fate (sporulation/competence/biofilm development) regulator YmcA (YheA/YmcA/DUF963 family)